MNDTSFRDDAQSQRFELSAGGEVIGFAQYSVSGDTVTITHTEVCDAYEGKGYGTDLARQALDRIRLQRLKVVPACRFIAGYIQRHPEYADLVQPEA